MTILGGLLDHSLAGRLLSNLVGTQRNGGADEIPLAPNGSDHGAASSKTDRGGWQNGPGDVRHDGNGHQTGGPSPPQPQGPPGMQTGGPAPQGMQDVFPNIAQQLASSLSSVVNSANSLTSALSTPAPPAQAANAQPQLGPTLADARAQLAGGPAAAGVGTPQAPLPAAPATPATAAANTSQAATPNAVANPASPTLSQPASTLARAAGETPALAPNRPAETALPPRPENMSLLSRLANALQLAPTLPATTVPTLPAPLPGATQAMTAAGLTMAASAVNPAADARGAILAANDHAAIRGDAALGLAGHTIDGLQRRLMRNRVQLIPQKLGRLLWAMGLMGAQTGDSETNAERDLQRAMQWLFWMLAVIAYGCLAVAIVALVGNNSRMFDYEASRTYTGWLAFFGLVTGTVAWLLARRMSRR